MRRHAQAVRDSVFERETSCSGTLYQAARQHALKQERIETNGDGVKPGSTSLMGLGGANVQLERERPRMNIFFGVPAESIFGGVKVRPRLFRNSVPVCFNAFHIRRAAAKKKKCANLKNSAQSACAQEFFMLLSQSKRGTPSWSSG